MKGRKLLRGTGAALVAGSLLAVTPTAVGAQTPSPTAGTRVTLEQAQAAALAAVPGTVVEFELERERGRTVYEFEIQRVSDNRVVEVTVDASTGAVLGNELDDDGPVGGTGVFVDDD
jgi:hypothetical protein